MDLVDGYPSKLTERSPSNIAHHDFRFKHYIERDVEKMLMDYSQEKNREQQQRIAYRELHKSLFQKDIQFLMSISSDILLDEHTYAFNCMTNPSLPFPVKEEYMYLFKIIMNRIIEYKDFIDDEWNFLHKHLSSMLFLFIIRYALSYNAPQVNPVNNMAIHGCLKENIAKHGPKLLPTLFKNNTTTAKNILSESLKKLNYDFIMYSNDGYGIAVHKWILCARWGFFDSMMNFNGAEMEKGYVLMDNWNLNTLTYVVNYLYTGSLPDMSFEVCKCIAFFGRESSLTEKTDVLLMKAFASMREYLCEVTYNEI